jgi:hypothetical protein
MKNKRLIIAASLILSSTLVSAYEIENKQKNKNPQLIMSASQLSDEVDEVEMVKLTNREEKIHKKDVNVTKLKRKFNKERDVDKEILNRKKIHSKGHHNDKQKNDRKQYNESRDHKREPEKLESESNNLTVHKVIKEKNGGMVE